MTRFAAAALALFSFMALTACETVEGAGRDLETAGKTISREAREAKR
ncbi:entericidin B [Rhodovulum iodosum]|uniref:Entericidin B n=1 Tax=Rhodovulum iodosum TaxID=68291 RepID=A0ABV3XSC7_9RHOB|nr:entericidin A/B family lipoprotein [Rhodovulum robiginosum]RSK30547.1 entericidin A/B family lipoprotein [Rhodovulum robiginosum]